MSYTFCTYGPPAERKRHWILRFEDADMGDMHFDNEAEALTAFDKASVNWTCTLYSTVLRPPPRDPNDYDHRAM